jgi:hypothetical protein
VTTGSGPRAIGVNFQEPMILKVANSDLGRPTFFDVTRPGGGDGRRQEIEPAQVFRCRVLPGPADITFGQGTEFVFYPEAEERDGDE